MLVSHLLFAHIAAGSVAVIAGATALLAPKGAAWHRAAGTLFVLTMIVTAVAGAGAALLKSQMITMLAGVFTCHLVTSSWLTVVRPTMGAAAHVLLLTAALGVAAAGTMWGLQVQQAVAAGAKDPFGAEPYFFFAGLAALAAAGDAFSALRGGLKGAQRIARHLWRMTFALFIAVGSFFTGPGASAFPAGLRGSPLLSAPELIVLALMFFWLGYTFLSGRFR